MERGFQKLGWSTGAFSTDQMGWEKDILSGHAYVAGVETNLKIAEFRGVDYDSIPDYPKELLPFLKREIRQTTLEQALRSLPVFVKPVQQKLFTGCVIESEAEAARIRQKWSDSTPVFCAERVNLAAEYRVYVLAGLVMNVARYGGSWSVQAEPATIQSMIRSFHNAPPSYVLDVGIDSVGQTLLVEVNDPLGMVNYGLAPEFHARMVAVRWLWMFDEIDSARALFVDEESPSFVW